MNTHSLKADGAAFSAGNLTRVDANTTKGSGVAVCGCGETSPVLDSRAARKAWHAEHKTEAVADSMVAQVEAQESKADNLAIDELTDQESDDFMQALEDINESEPVLDPEDEASWEDLPVVAEVTRVYKGGYAAVMSKALVARAGEHANTEAKAKRVDNTRVVTLNGPKTVLDDLVAESDQLEAQAIEELHTWQQADESRKTMTNNQRYAQSCKQLAGILAEDRHG